MSALSEQELNKVILIFGIGGMDGSTLADILLQKGYKNIHGVIRRSAVFNTQNIDHIFDKLTLHYGDLTDALSIHNIISKVLPNYLYNFAAMSHVAVSEEVQNYTFQTNTIGVLNILQTIKSLRMEKTCKIYHASTSEEFGNMTDGTSLLDENSPKIPVSIYGISKLAAENLCNMYRDAYGMFIVSSTLFNHENERRGKTFVTQKICEYVGKYSKNNNISPLKLGNLNAKRDWGYANDYCEGIYKMLIQEKCSNYVLATGETHSVREFVELAFNEIGINIIWNGDGLNEVGIDSKTKNILIVVDSRYYRPIDINCLIGDASKAYKELNWKQTTSFKELVTIMTRASIERNK